MTTICEAVDAIVRERQGGTAGVLDVILRTLPMDTLRASVLRWGTPQYFLDEDQLRSTAGKFQAAMRGSIPSVSCFYAFKCNDLPVLVQAVRAEGFGADVAGAFELELAVKSGFDRIVFSSPGKDVKELRLAVRHRDRVIVMVDSMDELGLLRDVLRNRRLDPPVRVGFRLRPTALRTTGEPWSKFGLNFDDVARAVRAVDETPALLWSGLHIHASWNKTPDRYVDNVRRISKFLSERVAREKVRGLSFVDLGGGFNPPQQASLLKSEDKGVLLELLAGRSEEAKAMLDASTFDPFAFGVMPVAPLEDFAKEIGQAVRDHLLPLNPDLAIYLEPGRYIATPSTTILLTVVAEKGDCVIVDGGINMLGDYKFSEYSFAPIVNLTRPNGPLCRRVVYGPLCDPHDLWGYSHYGDVLRKGDVVAVPHQGAYTFSTAWRFIKAVPPYVASRGGELMLAKKAESFRQRYAGCRM